MKRNYEEQVLSDDRQIAHYQDENRALRSDLLYIMAHPQEGCKMCIHQDKECRTTGVDCKPAWKGVGDR